MKRFGSLSISVGYCGQRVVCEWGYIGGLSQRGSIVLIKNDFCCKEV